MLDLVGKRVLVAGAASGIGAATARYLGECGARLHLGDIDVKGARRVAKEISLAGGQVSASAFDLHRPVSIARLVSDAEMALGGLDGLVNVAADVSLAAVDVAVAEMDPVVWAKTFEANTTGFALLIKHALPHLIAAGGGAVVNTSSGIATVGEAERPAYAASKAAINALTRHVAVAYGSQGIRANAVAPGLVLSESVEANLPEEFRTMLLPGIPLARHGQPVDLAPVIAFLVSPLSSWVSGQVWNINGGGHRRD